MIYVSKEDAVNHLVRRLSARGLATAVKLSNQIFLTGWVSL